MFNEAVIKTGFEKASGHWIELNPAKYKTYDGSHLNIESAQKLTHNVGKEVKKLVENPGL
ncbi:MAG: hypothetical protein IPF54_22450 [Draconibacterium sp.]|nr:hypothetical protein [Draconibacterium sp.]